MIIENIQDTIKQYLDGKMSATEKIDFENQIKNSEELAEEVRQFRQLRIFDKHKNLLAAKAQLSAVMSEIDIEPDYGSYEKYFKKSFFESPVRKWLAGSLATLALIGGIFFYQKSQTDNVLTNIYKSNLQPMENIIGFTVDDQTQAAKAMRAYDQKNYNEAITLLNYAVKNSTDDNSLRLYLAISYLMQERNIEAEILLKDIINKNDLTVIPAKWYLALSLIKRGEKTEARALLQSIESDTVFGNKASAILKSL
jgi:tetratricopeptide (TPR) repeat protein